MMFEYRITKYDPKHRDSSGAYTLDDWTSMSDIGKTFAGTVLTEAEYLRVEDAYVTTAIAVLREAGVRSLTVAGLENPSDVALSFTDGSEFQLSEIGEVIRRVLRDEFWCRLDAATSFVHIGWDYYLYLGVPVTCPDAVKLANKRGLFVERFESPFKDRSDTEYPLSSHILRQYLTLLAEPRYRSRDTIPDGSPLLDCLAYGLRKLVDDFKRGEDTRLSDAQSHALVHLEARLTQVAGNSKHLSSRVEWEAINEWTWRLIEELGWDTVAPPNSENS